MNKLTLPANAEGVLRALTIREPFATLVAAGIKKCETRVWPWPSNLQLPCTVAIHASNDDSYIGDDLDKVVQAQDAWDLFNNPECKPAVIGKTFFYAQTIVGLVDVIASVRVPEKATAKQLAALFSEHIEAAGCDVKQLVRWANSPYAFVLANARRFAQGIGVRGQMKVWSVPTVVQIHCKTAKLITGNTMPKPPIMTNGSLPRCLGKPNYADMKRNG